MTRMIQPIVLRTPPSFVGAVVIGAARLEEHDDEDDDQDECSESDADSHGCLLPWSWAVSDEWWPVGTWSPQVVRRATLPASVTSTGTTKGPSDGGPTARPT